MLVDEPTVDYDYTSIAAEVRIARCNNEPEL